MQAALLHKESVQSVPVDGVVAAVAQVINDSDLMLTSASLQVGTTLLLGHPTSASSVSSQMLQPALQLSRSTLLQVPPNHPTHPQNPSTTTASAVLSFSLSH